MTALLALLKTLAGGVLLSGLVGGVLAMYGTVTADQFDVIAPALVIVVLGAAGSYAYYRDRLAREPRGRHHARPAAHLAVEAPTVTLPAVPATPDAEPHDPTEPVVIAAPDTLYPDWPTGQFAAITGQQDGAA